MGAMSKRIETERRLQELSEALEWLGVESAAPAMARAMATGAGWYAEALSLDDAAWGRFRDSYRALLSPERRGRVHADEVTIGALAWLYVNGRGFMREVERGMRAATHARAEALH